MSPPTSCTTAGSERSWPKSFRGVVERRRIDGLDFLLGVGERLVQVVDDLRLVGDRRQLLRFLAGHRRLPPSAVGAKP